MLFPLSGYHLTDRFFLASSFFFGDVHVLQVAPQIPGKLPFRMPSLCIYTHIHIYELAILKLRL